MVPEILANWGLNERTTPRAFLDVARPRQAIGQPGRRPQGSVGGGRASSRNLAPAVTNVTVKSPPPAGARGRGSVRDQRFPHFFRYNIEHYNLAYMYSRNVCMYVQ